MSSSTASSFFKTLTLTLLRVVAPFVMMQHGAQKLFGAFGGVGPGNATVHLASLMGLAGVLEFFVALLVLVGLFTRPAAFLLSGEMAVAYFMVHAPGGFWTMQNHGETPVLLCFIFLLIVAFGPGRVSLDALLFQGRAGAAERSMSAAERAA